MKPSLSTDEQVELLAQRGLTIVDREECERFLRCTNYYRFSGYMRYFQKAPHLGDDSFEDSISFDAIRDIYVSDEQFRISLTKPLAQAELVLRTHVARVIADHHGAYGRYLEEDFYTDINGSEPTVESCLRDIERSRERHILRYRTSTDNAHRYENLPVWSAVEAWSFGTLSKVLERGDGGSLSGSVATSLGIPVAGFPYRVRAMVYLRNRCAHHSRLWNHSVIDAGPTPNNVRSKAKRIAGQFEPRSVLDVVASLSNFVERSGASDPLLPEVVERYRNHGLFWQGLTHPVSPQGCRP